MKKLLAEQAKEFSTKVTKNTFDTAFTHPMTANLGKVYPIFVEPMSPNTSKRINPTAAFQFRPMSLPMQTHVKMNQAYFYVRNNTIWDDFTKFTRIAPTAVVPEGIAHPYISRSKWTGVGTLADYMGIPCQSYSSSEFGTIKRYSGFGGHDGDSMSEYGSINHDAESWSSIMYTQNDPGKFQPYRDFSGMNTTSEKTLFEAPLNGACCIGMANSAFSKIQSSFINTDQVHQWNLGEMLEARNNAQSYFPNGRSDGYTGVRAYANYVVIEQPLSNHLFKGSSSFVYYNSCIINDQPVDSNQLKFVVKLFAGSDPSSATEVACYGVNTQDPLTPDLPVVVSSSDTPVYFAPFHVGTNKHSVVLRNFSIQINWTEDHLAFINDVIDQKGNIYFALIDTYHWRREQEFKTYADPLSTYSRLVVPLGGQTSHNYSTFVNNSETTVQAAGGFTYMEHKVDSPFSEIPFTPFDGVNPSQPINALPFRAYEAICNYHFRNRTLDPFMKNGEIAIDDYNTNHGSGADSTTPLEFFRAQYPENYFYSCLPKPMGNDYQPTLIGVTGDSSMQQSLVFTGKDGSDYTVKVQVRPEGNISQIDSYSESADKFTIDAIKEGIKYGITPQAITMANAFDKWYEASYRGGRYSYSDFVNAHFGHPATHYGTKCPEYLGGFTDSMQMDTVTNQTANGDVPLGYEAGIGSFSKGKSKPIECFADEEGWLIGVMWFSVDPINNQSIHKFWYRSQPMDYPTPELANLGSMPVLKKEIAPLQCTFGEDGTANELFGYQRNYADMITAWDYSSGLFRTEFSKMLFQRVFGTAPVISADLLKIDAAHLSNPFQEADSEKDKIYGFVHFDVQTQMWLNQTPNQMIM